MLKFENRGKLYKLGVDQYLKIKMLVSSLYKKSVERLAYLRVGGYGLCLGAGKTRSQKNT
jgi:hypothetical protein